VPYGVGATKRSCTEGSAAQVGARPTDEKRTSVSRAQSSWAGVGDKPAVRVCFFMDV